MKKTTKQTTTSGMAGEISTYVMRGNRTAEDLQKHFRLTSRAAQAIMAQAAYAIGPGGKGYDWYMKQVGSVLKGGKVFEAVSTQSVAAGALGAMSRSKDASVQHVNEGVADTHQRKIAVSTLKMSRMGAQIAGGMDHAGAVVVLKKAGWSPAKIASQLKKAGHGGTDIKKWMGESFDEATGCAVQESVDEAMAPGDQLKKLFDLTKSLSTGKGKDAPEMVKTGLKMQAVTLRASLTKIPGYKELLAPTLRAAKAGKTWAQARKAMPGKTLGESTDEGTIYVPDHLKQKLYRLSKGKSEMEFLKAVKAKYGSELAAGAKRNGWYEMLTEAEELSGRNKGGKGKKAASRASTRAGARSVVEGVLSIQDRAHERELGITDEAKAPKKMQSFSFSDQVDLNRATKGQKSNVTPALHAWASKKFGKGAKAEITTLAAAKQNGVISIYKPKGSMGTTTITVTPAGKFAIVRDDKGGGMMVTATTDYYDISGLSESMVEANDDKTDDLPAKAEAGLKAKAKEMGATTVTGKGPSVNATFKDQKKAQAFLKHAKTVGKAAMRRSGDTEFTVHIDEGAVVEVIATTGCTPTEARMTVEVGRDWDVQGSTGSFTYHHAVHGTFDDMSEVASIISGEVRTRLRARGLEESGVSDCARAAIKMLSEDSRDTDEGKLSQLSAQARQRLKDVKGGKLKGQKSIQRTSGEFTAHVGRTGIASARSMGDLNKMFREAGLDPSDFKLSPAITRIEGVEEFLVDLGDGRFFVEGVGMCDSREEAEGHLLLGGDDDVDEAMTEKRMTARMHSRIAAGLAPKLKTGQMKPTRMQWGVGSKAYASDYEVWLVNARRGDNSKPQFSDFGISPKAAEKAEKSVRKKYPAGTASRGNKLSFKESLEEASGKAVASDPPVIAGLRKVVREHQHQKVTDAKGKTQEVDATTANAVVTVYDGLSGANRKKFADFPLTRMVSMAWKVLGPKESVDEGPAPMAIIVKDIFDNGEHNHPRYTVNVESNNRDSYTFGMFEPGTEPDSQQGNPKTPNFTNFIKGAARRGKAQTKIAMGKLPEALQGQLKSLLQDPTDNDDMEFDEGVDEFTSAAIPAIGTMHPWVSPYGSEMSLVDPDAEGDLEDGVDVPEGSFIDERGNIEMLDEAIPATVFGFRHYLMGALTQYDQQQLTRSMKNPRAYYNPSALALYIAALNRAEKDSRMRGVKKDSSDPEDLKKFIATISYHFDERMPPVKKTLKAVNAFLTTGKIPNYPGSSSKRHKKPKISDSIEEGVDEGASLHDALVGLFAANAGRAYTASNIAKLQSTSLAEAMKVLTTLVREGTLQFKRGEGYSLRGGQGLRLPGATKGSGRPARITDQRTHNYEDVDEGDDGDDDPDPEPSGMDEAFDELNETRTGSVVVTFGDKEKRDEATKAVRGHKGSFACTTANCSETQLRVFWPESVETSSDAMVEKISSACEGGLFNQLGLRYVSIADAVVESLDETTTSGGVGGFARTNLGGHPENKGREGGVRDDSKKKKGPRSVFGNGAIGRVLEQMRESLPGKSDEELIELLNVDERTYKIVEVFSRNKDNTAPWVVADPYGKEWEYESKDEAMGAAQALADVELWDVNLIGNGVASESEDLDEGEQDFRKAFRTWLYSKKSARSKESPDARKFGISGATAKKVKDSETSKWRKKRDAACKKAMADVTENIVVSEDGTFSFERISEGTETNEDGSEYPVVDYQLHVRESVASNKRPVKLGPLEKEVMRVARKLRTQKFSAAEVQTMSPALGKLSTAEIGGAIDQLIRKGMLAGANDYFSILGEDAAEADEQKDADSGHSVQDDDSQDDDLEEAVVKTGNPEVPEIGYERGEYWYKSKDGSKNGPAVPPAKRKDREYARTKFRQMLSNEAGGGMGQATASKLLKKLDAMSEGVEAPEETVVRESLQFPESALEKYVLAAQAAGINEDDPCFVFDQGIFTVEVPAQIAPRLRELVGV